MNRAPPCLLSATLCLMAARDAYPDEPPHSQPSRSSPPSQPGHPGHRTDVGFDDSWRFHLGDVEGAADPSFDDSTWSRIHLPHTWNARDGEDGGNNYFRGIGWYRKAFVLDGAYAARRVLLQFDGANRTAEVLVNGVAAGTHRGGFARFRFDVTAVVHPGAPNVVAVKVDNADDRNICPLQADFTFFGGLYRDVHLLALDPVHIRALDHGADSVFVTQKAVSAARAELEIRTALFNDRSEADEVVVRTAVVDQQGTVVAEAATPRAIAGRTGAEVSEAVTLDRPHLWNGVADPYLYRVHVEVRRGEEVLDHVEQPLGLRSFRIDPDRGFFLNGAAYDLHGVNRHQDRLDMGWAITEKEQQEDFALIREVGATAVRLAHYQQAPAVFDLSDRAGLVVWVEIPLVEKVTDSVEFADNARQQLVELIRQNYNHPSVVFWGIGNEQRRSDAATNRLLSELNALVHTEDPTRLSTYAHCCLPDDDPVARHTDVIGYNRYQGWYSGAVDDFGPWADAIHRANPRLRIGISEFGAGASVRQHAIDPARPAPAGRFHPEEYQALFHEAYWKAMKDRPYLWGKFVWNMFDFAVDQRDEGDTPGRNDKGLGTYDRRTRKDAFYWYKANWSNAPFVHITSRRFSARTSPATEVKVYSNCDSVELRVNGRSLGVERSEDRIFRWPSVTLARGDNTIEAIGRRGEQTFSDRCRWQLAPVNPAP